MRDVVDMWGNTRMVVLTAITASIYAAILIPFKVLPIIPGVTEFRPGNAIPIVCSFLFGPAAAWGAAIGNLIGDFFGGLGPGDIFGFAGNFLYGLVPYKLWAALARRDPVLRDIWRAPSLISRAAYLALLAGVIFVAAASCAFAIGWGHNALAFHPFSVLANIILVNNFVVSIVLAPLLLGAVYPRVRDAHLLYTDVMPAPPPGRARALLGASVVVIAIVGGFTLCNLASTGALQFGDTFPTSASRAYEVGVTGLPAIVLLGIGLLLL